MPNGRKRTPEQKKKQSCKGAVLGFEAHGDTFHDDRQPDLKADYVLANPPFTVLHGVRRIARGTPDGRSAGTHIDNISDWHGERLVGLQQ